MSGSDETVLCHTCRSPIEGEPEMCPSCGRNLITLCLCGLTYHITRSACPDCGRRNRVRRRKDKLRHARRRMKLALVLVILTILLVVNLVVVFRNSPSRRSNQYYQDGLSAFEGKQYSSAEVAFRSYLDIVPDRAEARYMLGMALMWQGREEDAERELREAIRLQEGLDVAHVDLSDHLRRRGDLRGAKLQALLAIETPPAPPEAYVVLGEVEIELGDVRAAIAATKHAIAERADMTEAQLRLGDMYLALEMRSDVDVTKELAGRCYREAMRQARRNLAREPWDTKSRVWLAKALAGVGEVDEAIPHLESAIGERRFEPELRCLLAMLLVSNGDAQGAARVLRKAAKETPSARIALDMSRILAGELRNPTAARRTLDRGIEKFPGDVTLRIARVALLADEAMFAAAERDLSEALEEFPNDGELLEAGGDLHLERGDEESAVAAWRRALGSRPQNLSARRKLLGVLGPRAVAAIASGRDATELVGEVEGHLTFLLDPSSGLSRSDLGARSLRARLAFARGDYAEAAELMGANLELADGSYEELRLLGIAYLRSAELHRASETLLRALEHPDSPHSTMDYELAYDAARHARRATIELGIAKDAAVRWPNDAEWRLRLAESLFRVGLERDALEACALAQGLLDPARTRDVRGHLLAQRILLSGGQIAAAREQLDSAMLLRRDIETRTALYAFFAATGEERLAEDGFRSLVEEHPDDPGAKLRYGDFLARRGSTAGALAQYERAVEIAPASRDAFYRLAELRLAMAAAGGDPVAVAAEAVRRIRESSPDDPYIHYLSGRLNLLEGENDAALEDLSRFAAESPGDAGGCYHLALAHRRTGDPARARRILGAVLRIEPGMVEAKLELASLVFTDGPVAGESLVSLGELGKAAEEAESVLGARPDDVGALFVTGTSLVATSDLEGAERRFRRLVELEPANYRSHLHLGMLLTKMERYDEARERLLEAYSLEPDVDEVLRTLAGVHVARGKAEDALRLVTVEQERRPGSAFILHLLGDLHRDAGRSREAVKAYLQAFSLSPDDDLALLRAASILADEGDHEQAIEALAQGAKNSSAPAGLLTLRGRMLLARGNRAAAEAALREALVADSGHAEACRELGELCVVRGRNDEGRRLLQAAVARGLVDSAVHFRLGQLAEREGRSEDAEASFRRVVELAPENAAALSRLASVVAESPKRLAEALPLARRARELAPEDPSMADTLGWILGRLDSFDEAIPLLVQAAKAFPDDAETQYHAGLTCFRAYHWEEARGYLERAIGLDPDRPEAAEAWAALNKIR